MQTVGLNPHSDMQSGRDTTAPLTADAPFEMDDDDGPAPLPLPPPDVPLYRCQSCTLPLALTDDLVSRAFQGSTGPAILVRNAWNVKEEERETKNLMSGTHVIASTYHLLFPLLSRFL